MAAKKWRAVKLPKDLADRLERDARAEGRTLAQHVRFVLERRK